MQNQSQSTRDPETPDDASSPDAKTEIKKDTKTMTALLWPAMIVLAVGIIIILIFAVR